MFHYRFLTPNLRIYYGHYRILVMNCRIKVHETLRIFQRISNAATRDSRLVQTHQNNSLLLLLKQRVLRTLVYPDPHGTCNGKSQYLSKRIKFVGSDIWGRLKSMTSQNDEEDQKEINFSLTPFSSFRYQRREKGVHLTLKRERTPGLVEMWTHIYTTQRSFVRMKLKRTYSWFLWS